MKNERYVGVMRPLDVDAKAAVAITVGENHEVLTAEAETEGGSRLRECAAVLCEQLVGKDARDFFQMNNNVIYYNIEPELTLSELWQASVAVMAAKRAAADYCRKNGIPYDAGSCQCV